MNLKFTRLYFHFVAIQTIDLDRGLQDYMRKDELQNWKTIDEAGLRFGQ